MRRVLVLVLLLVVGACSDDGAEARPTTTTTSTTTTTTASATTTVVDGPVEAVGEVVHGELETADGRTRTYRVYLPTRPAPDAALVLALHGGTGNGDQYARSSGYDGWAEATGSVVVYPDGTPTAFGDRRLVWNGGGCCAAAVRDGVDDVAFLTALIDELAAEHDLDPSRALVTGHSNGGIMALRMACEAAGHVAAVAVQAGTVFVDDCAPSEPVSVLALHGADDANLPLAGGTGVGLAGVAFPPVADGLAAIAAADGCEGSGAGGSWDPCPDGVDVELAVVPGEHAWLPDASERLWTFLSAHRG